MGSGSYTRSERCEEGSRSVRGAISSFARCIVAAIRSRLFENVRNHRGVIIQCGGIRAIDAETNVDSLFPHPRNL
jgi:hypothetical protein